MEQYLELFPREAAACRVGESSVWYLYSESAPAEMLAFCPQADIIIMLRNPADMAYSLHSQLVFLGVEPEHSFEVAISLDELRAKGTHRICGGFPPQTYLNACSYSKHVERYLSAFGRERVHVVKFDDFQRDPGVVYRRICRKLGVEESFEPSYTVVNPNKQVRSMGLRRLIRWPSRRVRRTVHAVTSQRVRASVAARINKLNSRQVAREPMNAAFREHWLAKIKPDVCELEQLLNEDLSDWYEKVDSDTW